MNTQKTLIVTIGVLLFLSLVIFSSVFEKIENNKQDLEMAKLGFVQRRENFQTVWVKP